MQGIVKLPFQKDWAGKLACSIFKYQLMIVLIARSMVSLTGLKQLLP